MIENQTPTPVPLPPPLRYLTEDENNHVKKTASEQTQNYGMDEAAAMAVAYAALGAIGLFGTQSILAESNDEKCNALRLAWDAAQPKERMYLGLWFQCIRDPGHDSDHVAYSIVEWSDGEPGTVPATRTA
ncbi:hypothetical protein ACFOY2_01950 [Nonomuraea purpurea]|uniref:DUF732 domain-containing protein n=1 Tax=Nonomuraea purpurea TaxID=1849276 RepID=A0ABV8FWY0_9ACTN